MPFDLQKLTDTTRSDLEQLALDRKEDFLLLRANGRWTTSVYFGPYIVELKLKAKICELLDIDYLPAVFKTHDLEALAIYAGLQRQLDANSAIQDNLRKINTFHAEAKWRYRPSDPRNKVDSDNLNDWLFHPTNGVAIWLGL